MRSILRDRVRWTAELLVDLPPEQMPPPFTAPEHDFDTLEEAFELRLVDSAGARDKRGPQKGALL